MSFTYCYRRSWVRLIRRWWSASITRNTMTRNAVPISATYRPLTPHWKARSKNFRFAIRKYYIVIICTGQHRGDHWMTDGKDCVHCSSTCTESQKFKIFFFFTLLFRHLWQRPPKSVSSVWRYDGQPEVWTVRSAVSRLRSRPSRNSRGTVRKLWSMLLRPLYQIIM